MYSVRKLGYLFVFVITLCSCSDFSEIVLEDVQSVEIKGFEENKLIVGLGLLIDNPTAHKITLDNLDAKMFMNGTYLGKVGLADKLVIEKKQKQLYKITIQVRLVNFLGTAFTVMNLRQGQSMQIKLEGTVISKTLFIRKKIKISEDRKITL